MTSPWQSTASIRPDSRAKTPPAGSIGAPALFYVASQVRTCQQIEPARENLARLRAVSIVLLIEPVSYEKVLGIGFYRQFLSIRDWPGFMAHFGAAGAGSN